MKKAIFYTLMAIFMFTACRNINKASKTDSLANVSTLDTSPTEFIKKLKPILQGVWVKVDYVNKVIRTKSPLAAEDEVDDITTMYIETDSLKGDSINVPEGAGNHDGSTLVLKFKQGKSKSSLLFGAGELIYSIEGGDPILTYSRFERDDKKWVKTKFIRIFKKEPNNRLADGMYYYINMALVAGDYTTIDSIGKVNNVTFTADGKVQGFLNFDTYQINIDLDSDVNDNLDAIYFKNTGKEHRNLSFKIIDDTLKLYDTRENPDSTKLILDKLRYKLVRQK